MTTSSDESQIFAVYRIEGEVAIVVGEELDEVAVPLSDLPDSISEETVLRVPLQPDRTPVWRAASIDDETGGRRRAEASEALLKKVREWQEEQREKKGEGQDEEGAAAGEDG